MGQGADEGHGGDDNNLEESFNVKPPAIKKAKVGADRRTKTQTAITADG